MRHPTRQATTQLEEHLARGAALAVHAAIERQGGDCRRHRTVLCARSPVEKDESAPCRRTFSAISPPPGRSYRNRVHIWFGFSVYSTLLARIWARACQDRLMKPGELESLTRGDGDRVKRIVRLPRRASAMGLAQYSV